MNAQDDKGRSRLTIPILIAAVAVMTALGAIVVALRAPPADPVPVSPPAVAAASGANDQQPRISKALRSPLRSAQDALKSRNYQDAIATLEAADRTQDKSPYDQHIINLLLFGAYAGVKNYEASAKCVEALLKDGFLTPSEMEKETGVAALLNYQIKNYEKAIEFGTRAMGSVSPAPQIPTMVAQAYYLKGDWGGAERFEEVVVARQIAAGTTPDRLSLNLWLSACLKLHDTGCERQALGKLIAYYPTLQTQRELERLQAGP
jgi:tetratricopeptide (TPR) repeat protein